MQIKLCEVCKDTQKQQEQNENCTIKKEGEQFLALINLQLECEKLKSVDFYIKETEQQINELNTRLDNLTQNILQYNKLMDLTKKQIEVIRKELENE